MFELADRLVGIYKIYNCTRSITINPKLYGVPSSQGQPASQASQVSWVILAMKGLIISNQMLIIFFYMW